VARVVGWEDLPAEAAEIGDLPAADPPLADSDEETLAEIAQKIVRRKQAQPEPEPQAKAKAKKRPIAAVKPKAVQPKKRLRHASDS